MKRREVIAGLGGVGLLAASRVRAAETAAVKIGVLTDMNGPSSDMSGPGSVTAARMAVADAGPVPGGTVEVITGNHQMKPDIGTTIASDWYDTKGIDLIVDVPFSAVGLAVENVSRRKQKLVIVSGTGADEFTGKLCSPYAMQWTFDSYALAAGTAGAMLKRGAKTFYFITPDYAFGHSLEQVATARIVANGGKVLGHSVYPFGTPDMSSFLLTAQASGADVIAVAAGPPDNINCFKQAANFGIGRGKQQLAALLGFINDIHAIGLPVAQGLVLTTAFYWDRDAATRTWSQRFAKTMGKEPSMVQAGVYSAVLHYLRAVQAVGGKAPLAVAAKMRAMPVNDVFARNGTLRADGLMVHDMLLVKVKAPSQSHSGWDLYDVLDTIPAAEAYPPLAHEGCKLPA